jgi:hypothetical protein
VFVFLYSCDKDYNSIGDGLIGDNHFDFVKYIKRCCLQSKKRPIESNNLPVNALGIDNPALAQPRQILQHNWF